MKHYLSVIIGIFCMLFSAGYGEASPTLSIGHIEITQGETQEIDLLISGGTEAYAGFNAAIVFPPGITVKAVSRGALLPMDQFTLAHRTELSDSQSQLYLLGYSSDAAFGTSDGVIAVITVEASETAVPGSHPVAFATQNPTAGINTKHALSNAGGTVSVAHDVQEGTITVSGGNILDSDQDGLPDQWELAHFGDLSWGGGDDPDRDGFTNDQEFENQTDPSQPDWTNPAHFQYSMTVYAAVENQGVAIEGDGSRLAAYKGSEARGVVDISDGPLGKLFQLTVVSDESSESGISFRIFDALEGVVYDIEETIDFSPNTFVGSIAQPRVLHVKLQDAEQSIPVVTGWNWISFNTLPEDRSPNAVLENFTARDNDVIKTSPHYGGTATFYGDTWYGLSGQGIQPGVMYLLNTSAPSPEDVIIQGEAVSAAEPIAVVPGWNWIGYTPRLPMVPDTALESLDSSDNDVIKTSPHHGGTATFYGGRWYGLNDGMKPGVGYLLKSAKEDSLVYPDISAPGIEDLPIPPGDDTSGQVDPPIEISISETTNIPDWENPVNLQNSMTLHAKVIHAGDQVPVTSQGSLLAAFKDGICRGVVSIDDGPAGRWFQLTIASDLDSESDIILKVYDAAADQVYPVRQSLEFAVNEIKGSIIDPLTFTAGTAVEPLKGDIDGNGTVDFEDAKLILRILTLSGNGGDALQGDTNNDGIISVADLIYILRQLAME